MSTTVPPASSGDSSARPLLPDLFLPPGGSKGYMDPATRGKGAGVVLDDERKAATFPVEKMTLLLHGGAERLERRRCRIALVENNPVFRKWDKHFQSRPERMARAAEKMRAMVELLQQHQITDPLERFSIVLAIDDLLPNELHRSMFIPTLESQASPAQLKEWLPAATDYRMLGTYVQTELGHGSFVRGLETTATYDPQTQEFVLNSPTLTSTKWWPGNLGKSSTHCVLMARLISLGQDHGIHGFYLPLRDPQTYACLPGRIIGDIGPKMGYESNDNGFLRLDHVRIPRKNHLAKYVEVQPDGTVGPTPGAPRHAKMAYLTMVFTRSMIVMISASQLAKAVTIATRYSAVRHQFPDLHANGRKESAVLNYQTQQLTLFTLLSQTYAMHFSGQYMRRLYFESISKLTGGDTSVMAALHATSSGLKAVCTDLASEGMEKCRKACGGHGYSRFSGIVDLYLDFVPATTYEGDNTVMLLQTARSLVKLLSGVRSGKVPQPAPSASTHYLTQLSSVPGARASFDRAAQLSSRETPQLVSQAFRHRSARLLSGVAAQLAESRQARPEWKLEQHLEGLKVALVRMARAHCMLVLVDNFYNAIAEEPAAAVGKGAAAHGETGVAPELRPVLRDLADLFALSSLVDQMGDWTEDGYFDLKQASLVRARALALLAAIRPNAVALVDAFDFTDQWLNSALGRYDGDVYQCLWDWAQRNPLNADMNEPGPGVRESVMPLLQGQRLQAKL